MQILLIASLTLAGLYLCYKLIFRRIFHPQWQRLALLLTLGLSLLAPWRPLRLVQVVAEYEFNLAPVIISPAVAEAPLLPWISMENLYLWIVCIGFTLLIINVLKVVYRILAWPRATVAGRRVILSGGRLGTSSFLHWIFWDETQAHSEAEATVLIAHERCHLRQGHSIDMLLCAVAQALLWFHPVIYLLRRDLIRVHEYLADHEALRYSDPAAYRKMLIEASLGGSLPLAHSFHTSFITQRIRMLQQPFSRHARLRSLLWLIPALLLVLSVHACFNSPESAPQEVTLQGPPPAPLQIEAADPERNTAIEGYEPVAVNLDPVKREIGYPQEARDNGQQGAIICRILVDEKGQYVQHEVLKADSDILKAEVEKHIHKLTFKPAIDKSGQPMRFWVNIPFNFVLLE